MSCVCGDKECHPTKDGFSNEPTPDERELFRQEISELVRHIAAANDELSELRAEIRSLRRTSWQRFKRWAIYQWRYSIYYAGEEL